MNTTGQPDGQQPDKSPSGRTGARADTLDIVLLILTNLVLAGTAAGIVIGFPQALEIVAAHANAAVAVSADAHTPAQQEQSAEENEAENEPFFADDIRTAAAVYAAAGAGTPAQSVPEAPPVSR